MLHASQTLVSAAVQKTSLLKEQGRVRIKHYTQQIVNVYARTCTYTHNNNTYQEFEKAKEDRRQHKQTYTYRLRTYTYTSMYIYMHKPKQSRSLMERNKKKTDLRAGVKYAWSTSKLSSPLTALHPAAAASPPSSAFFCGAQRQQASSTSRRPKGSCRLSPRQRCIVSPERRRRAAK